MRMQLRIQRTARIVTKPSIQNPARNFQIVGPRIIPFADPDRSQLFQFVHRLENRLVMSRSQTRIEQRHDRNRFRSRTLKIKKSDSRCNRPLSQFPTRQRIDIPLEQTECIHLDILHQQVEIPRQRTIPAADYFFMLRIIIIGGQMICIKRFSRTIHRFNLGHIEHRNTPDFAPVFRSENQFKCPKKNCNRN